MHSIIFLIALLIPISSTYATQTLLQMGGNCESGYGRKGKDNIFLKSMASLRKKLTPEWKTITLYDADPDGFAAELKNQKVQDANPLSVKPSSSSTLFAELDRLIEENERDQPEKNQVLLWMNTHGSKGKICISETEIIDYDDPRLTTRLEKLKAHAKLGFVNEACFGGGAIPPLSKYGCVLSAQSENFFSFGDPVSQTLISRREKEFSLADLYLASMGSSALTSPQISGFSAGVKASNAFEDQFRKVYDDPLAKADIGKYRKDTECCQMSASEAMGLPGQKLIQDLLVAEDEKQMRRFFKGSIKSQAKLEKQFDAWLKEVVPIQKEFEKLSKDLVPTTFDQLKDPSVIYLPNTWLRRDYGDAETRKVVADALAKASAAAGVVNLPDYHLFLGNAREDGMALTPSDPESRDWKKSAEVFYSTFEAEVKKAKVDLGRVVSLGDPNYRDMAAFANQGKATEMASETKLLRYKATEPIQKRLDQIEKKTTSYYSNTARIHDLNQLLARRYLQAGRDQKLSTEEKAMREQCEDFKLITR
jgi:hypothetical protein